MTSVESAAALHGEGSGAASAATPLRHPVALGAAGYCALLLAAYQAPPGVAILDTVSGLLQYLPLCLLAAWGFWSSARSASGLSERTREALRLIAGALLLFALGMFTYSWNHSVAGQPSGLPILGDLFYIPGYLLLLGGLLRLPPRHPGGYRGWHLLLDAAVVLVGVGLVTWHLVIRPTAGVAGGQLDLVVRVGYPILGLGFLLAINALLLRGGPVDCRAGFAWLASAVLLYVIADAGYQLLYYRDTAPAPWLERLDEAGYATAYLMLVLAGLQYRTHRLVRDQRLPEAMHSLPPLPLLVTGAVAALLTVVAFVEWQPGSSPLILGLIALTILLIARQGITARQNTALLREQARRDGDARMAALVRHATDLFVVTETDGTIRFASPSLQPLLGWAPDGVTGLNLQALVAPDDRREFTVPAEGDDGAARRTMTVRLRHRDGSTRECEVIVTNLSGEPAVQGIVFVARDLSERRALESRLQQAQRMEAVGRLAGGIAHDFNNLLTTILAETELLLEGQGGAADDQDELGTIHQAALQAADLTRQLLAFSRRQVTSARAVDMAQLVGGTLRMFRRSAGPITIERQVASNLSRAWADPHQISQVLLNLLLNARDAMPSGGTVTIALSNLHLDAPWSSTVLAAPPGDYVMLEVADTGIGMDAATRDRVFEPFFTTKASGHGTGLGLPTVLSTIEQHRGALSIVSAQGAGTRVIVLLPVARVVEAAPGGEPAPVPSLPGLEHRGRERVLLVDDEEAVRDVTRRILERLGYAVETAASADQARRVLAVSGRPDLLLTDVIMPEESGPQLAEQLRTDCPGLPVLYISGFTGDELQRQGTLRSGTAFLQKPYTPRELAERVRAVLDDRGDLAGAGAGENPAIVRS